MKNIINTFIIGIIILFVSCNDDEHKGDSPDLNDNVGAVTLLNINPDKNFFNLNAPDFANEEVEFTVDIDNFGLTEVQSVDLEIEYVEKGALTNPFTGNLEDSTYAPVVVGNITSFPTTVSISATDVAAALNKSVDDFEVGDSFTLTLPIFTADGRRLTVALNSDLCNQPAQPSFGGCAVRWAVSCPSDLAGNYTSVVLSSNIDLANFRSPQAVTISGSAGNYILSDGTADIFGPDFPIGLAFTEVCESISIIPASVGFPTQVIFDQISTSYDPVSGVIIMNIAYNSGSCCGLAGIQYELELTPN